MMMMAGYGISLKALDYECQQRWWLRNVTQEWRSSVFLLCLFLSVSTWSVSKDAGKVDRKRERDTGGKTLVFYVSKKILNFISDFVIFLDVH